MSAPAVKHEPLTPLAWIDEELAELDARGLRRVLSTLHATRPALVSTHDGDRINFGSNDYLGLASDPRLAAAAIQAASDGWGAGASPLITGHTPAQQRLECRLAEFVGTPAALVFSSGYAANVGAVSALAGRDDVIFSDRRNHASLIDGCRLSRARVQIYPHADTRTLESLLRSDIDARRRLIVTESLYSMDGDCAPLVELAQLAERYDCMLLVDEAHATGVLGPRGRGLAELLGIEDRVHVRVGTLSKALGSSGGFVSGSEELIDWLVNTARTFVFSTAPPVPVCAAALAAIDIVEQEPWRRTTLLESARGVRDVLRSQGWTLAGHALGEGQIIPLLAGEPAAAIRLSERLAEFGLCVPAIRPPSVPTGRSLLRISLSCAHTRPMIDQLLTALAQLRAEVAR